MLKWEHRSRALRPSDSRAQLLEIMENIGWQLAAIEVLSDGSGVSVFYFKRPRVDDSDDDIDD